ncbi:MAG: hypothetical protein ACE5JI_09585 [Acidobacteriota bacterium]
MQRSLTSLEREEAALVFADSVAFDAVRIKEQDPWPLRTAALGTRLRRLPAPETNAFTLGNTLRFSRLLRTGESAEPTERLTDMAWIVHELTHVWQYQKFGWVYLLRAVAAQVRLGAGAYRYSEADDLEAKGRDLQSQRDSGRRFGDFNPEQQGDIARDFYFALKRDMDLNGWLPFIAEMRSAR